MKKQLLSLMFLGFIITVSPNNLNAVELPKDVLEDGLIKILQGPILSVVGVDWFRGNEKIIEIKQDKEDIDAYCVEVQVVTFEGPHKPPYMQENLTFRIKGNKVIPTDYFNRVIPESEWNKFGIE